MQTEDALSGPIQDPRACVCQAMVKQVSWIPPAGRSSSQMQERVAPSAGEGPALAPEGARPG
jgi:hypothetical protein